MSARLGGLDGLAKGSAPSNSPAADQLLHNVFPAPYGAIRRIARRLGRRDRWVYDQSEGVDPLTVSVALEVLAEHPTGVAQEAAGEALAPLGLIVLRQEEPANAVDIMSAHSQILDGFSVLEGELARSLGNDGKIDSREAATLGAIGGELKARVEMFLTQLRGAAQ